MSRCCCSPLRAPLPSRAPIPQLPWVLPGKGSSLQVGLTEPCPPPAPRDRAAGKLQVALPCSLHSTTGGWGQGHDWQSLGKPDSWPGPTWGMSSPGEQPQTHPGGTPLSANTWKPWEGAGVGEDPPLRGPGSLLQSNLWLFLSPRLCPKCLLHLV